LLALLLSIVFAAFYYAAESSGEVLVVASDILFVLVSGVCSVFSYLVLRRWGTGGMMGTARLGFFLGMFLWFLGELGWTVFEVIMNVPIPYPSLADVFYLCGYLPVAVGVMRLLSVFKNQIDRKRILVAIFTAVVVAGLTGVFVLQPLLVESTDLLSGFLDIAYPILDLVILMPCLLVMLTFSGGSMAKSWLWITFGLALTTLADLLFIHGTLTGWYYSGHPAELPYLWGYVCLGLGFQIQRTELG